MSAAAAHGDPGRQHYGLTMGVLLLAALAYALQQTMVAPALPEIQRELGTSTTAVSFVFTAFLLAASVSTPIVGRLGDMFGKERMLVVTLGIFGTGSLVCALSGSIGTLIAGRAVQGLGAAVFPLAFGIIRDEFPPERVSTGIGTLSATFGIGGGAGLVLSGIIVDALHYEWLFWLALPMILVAIVATHLFIPESPVRSPARIDWIGAILLTVGLVALLLGVSEANTWGWGSPKMLGMIVGGFAVIAGWVAFERRQPQPLVDMELMRRPAVFTTNLAALLVGFGMFGSFILIPQLVQVPESTGFGLGASVTEAGLFLIPSSFVMLFAGPLAGWLGGRMGSSKVPLMIGTAMAASAFGLLAADHAPEAIYIGSALMGLGIGFSFASMANLVVDAVPQTQTGVATGINTIMRTIGGALGGQIAASVVAGHLAADGLPKEAGFTMAFAISTVGLLAAFGAACAIPLRGGAATFASSSCRVRALRRRPSRLPR